MKTMEQNSMKPQKGPQPREQQPKEPEPADNSVDEASRESFPASDAPAWPVPTKHKKHK